MQKQAYVKLHISILLWGFTGILGKAISLNQEMLVWYRMLITTLILAAIAIVWKKKNLIAIKKEDRLKLVLVSAILVAHWITFYGSIKASNVSIALSCLATTACFTAITEPLIHRRAPQWAEIFLSLIAVFGIYIIYSFQQVYLAGILLGMISALLSSWLMIGNSLLVKNNAALSITFLEMLIGCILLSLIIPFATKNMQLWPQQMDWIYLLILSACCTVVPFILSLQALKHISAFTANLSINLEPVYSIALAFLIFKENANLNWQFYIGTLLILSSVVIHVLYKKLKKPALLIPD